MAAARKSSRRVRFVRAWQAYRVGDEIEPGGVLRDWLVAQGLVEVLQAPPVSAEVEAPRRPARIAARAAAKISALRRAV